MPLKKHVSTNNKSLAGTNMSSSQAPAHQRHELLSLTPKIADVPFETVASIAASFSASNINNIEAIGKAYKLLEEAAAAQRELKSGIELKAKLNIESLIKIGIIRYRLRSVLIKQLLEPKIYPKYSKYGLDGEPIGCALPTAFNEVLNALLPKGKMSIKEAHFTRWLVYQLKVSPAEVDEFIVEMKKEGIPWTLVQDAKISFPQWWKEYKHEAKSRSGSIGQAQKKRNAEIRASKTLWKSVVAQTSKSKR